MQNMCKVYILVSVERVSLSISECGYKLCPSWLVYLWMCQSYYGVRKVISNYVRVGTGTLDCVWVDKIISVYVRVGKVISTSELLWVCQTASELAKLSLTISGYLSLYGSVGKVSLTVRELLRVSQSYKNKKRWHRPFPSAEYRIPLWSCITLVKRHVIFKNIKSYP